MKSKKGLIPIAIPKGQILPQMKGEIQASIDEALKYEEKSLVIDHIMWTLDGLVVYMRTPTKNANKK